MRVSLAALRNERKTRAGPLGSQLALTKGKGWMRLGDVDAERTAQRGSIALWPGHAEASEIVLLDGTLEIVSEGKLKPGDSFAFVSGAQIIGKFDQVIPADFTVDIGAKSVSTVYKACYGDCDASGAFDLFDFLCFTNLFNAQDPAADCNGDGSFDLFDFLCFTNFFNGRC